MSKTNSTFIIIKGVPSKINYPKKLPAYLIRLAGGSMGTSYENFRRNCENERCLADIIFVIVVSQSTVDGFVENGASTD